MGTLLPSLTRPDGQPARAREAAQGAAAREGAAEAAAGRRQRVGRRTCPELWPDHTPAIIYTSTTDPSGTSLIISPQVESLLGYSPGDFEADPEFWTKCLHPDDRERVVAARNDHTARREGYRLSYRVIGGDGQVHWILDQGTAVSSSAGESHGIQGILLDITEQMEADARARGNEARFRKVVESCRDVFSIHDLEGHCVYFNASRELGMPPEDVYGKSPCDYLDEPAAARLMIRVREAASGRSLSVEDWVVWRSRKLCLLFTIYPLHDDSGHIMAVATVVRDITERKLAEDALHRSEALSRAVLETAPDGILSIDESGRIEAMNPAAEALFGYGEAEAAGMDVRALIPAFHNVRPAENTPDDGESAPARNGEAIGRHRDGTSFPIDLAVGVNRLDDRRFFTAIVRDLTDRRVLQEQLFQAQKMEAVGRLAGGIAHDFNNYLTVVSCNLDLMTAALPLDYPLSAELLKAIEQMRKAWQGATSLTRQLLAFSRRRPIPKECVDPNVVIVELDRMLRPLIGEDIRLEVIRGRDVRPIKADAGHLEQVVMNLVVNARDAMPDGGMLRIETAHEAFSPLEADATHLAPGDYVCISVTDTGVGMPPEVVRHIFEPFYTTKPIGRGTGLGLPTVYGIVQQLGGRVTVETEPGRGTTFRVYLPMAETEAVPAAVTASAAESCGRETILVCEDEPMILRLTTQILKAKGYHVLSAAGPREAIDMASTFPGDIDLLVSDVIMPEMNGRRLSETLSAGYPRMAVLFVSGYTADILGDQGLAAGEAALLEKPFKPAALLERVRTMLDARAEASAIPVGV